MIELTVANYKDVKVSINPDMIVSWTRLPNEDKTRIKLLGTEEAGEVVETPVDIALKIAEYRRWLAKLK